MVVASMGLVQEVGESIGDGAHRVTHFPDPQEEERENNGTDTGKTKLQQHLQQSRSFPPS